MLARCGSPQCCLRAGRRPAPTGAAPPWPSSSPPPWSQSSRRSFSQRTQRRPSAPPHSCWTRSPRPPLRHTCTQNHRVVGWGGGLAAGASASPHHREGQAAGHGVPCTHLWRTTCAVLSLALSITVLPASSIASQTWANPRMAAWLASRRAPAQASLLSARVDRQCWHVRRGNRTLRPMLTWVFSFLCRLVGTHEPQHCTMQSKVGHDRKASAMQQMCSRCNTRPRGTG
jgi:hypothetical protein